MSSHVPHRRDFLAATATGLLAGQLAWPTGGAATEPTPSLALSKRIGFPTYMFKHYTLQQMLAICERLDVKQLCLRSFHLPLEASQEQTSQTVAQARQAGYSVFGVGVVYLRDTQSVVPAFQYARAAGVSLMTISPLPELLPLIEEQVQQHDIRVAIHDHGPDDVWATPRAIYDKIKHLDPRIGICHDTGHTLRAAADPITETLATRERVFDLHLKDVDAPKKEGQSVELGRGIMNIPGFLRTLGEINYTGVVGIEYEKSMTDIVPGLAECVGYLRGLLTALEGDANRSG